MKKIQVKCLLLNVHLIQVKMLISFKSLFKTCLKTRDVKNFQFSKYEDVKY